MYVHQLDDPFGWCEAFDQLELHGKTVVRSRRARHLLEPPPGGKELRLGHKHKNTSFRSIPGIEELYRLMGPVLTGVERSQPCRSNAHRALTVIRGKHRPKQDHKGYDLPSKDISSDGGIARE